MKTLEVVCALILDHKGKLLVCKRGPNQSRPHKWEFPGGKIKASETAPEALVREIHEELQIRITPLLKHSSILSKSCHQYPDIRINLLPFLCELSSTCTPVPVEHAEIRWIDPTDASILDLDWSEADIPILKQYITTL